MLQIFLYGEQESGFLDLDPGTILDIESMMDAFDEELTIGEFSIPINVPWSNKNKRMMGFAERLQNFDERTKEFRITAYDNYVPEIAIGKLTILEKSGLFTYKKGFFSCTISGGKGLFGSAIKNKKLRSLDFGGLITWQNDESRKFAEDVMKGNYPQYDYFKFAPVAIEEFIDAQRADYNGENLDNDTVNGIIITGTGTNDWTFDRRDPSHPNQALPTNSPGRMDYQTVPFFKLMWVFKKVFSNLGYTPTGELVNSNWFDNAYIFNNYGLEYYAVTTFGDFNHSIFPANHLPDILASDFVKAVMDLFCIYPTFPKENEIKLNFRTDILNKKSIFSITDIVAKNFTETFTDNENSDKSGYKLILKKDDNDSFFTERIKEDLSDKIIAGTVAKLSDLATFNPGYQLTTDHIVFVIAENMYYVVADATNMAAIKWDCFAEKLEDYTYGDGERQVEIGVGVLASYVQVDSTTNLLKKMPYVGSRQKGSYRNKANVRVSNPFSFRIFYIDMLPIGVGNVIAPVSYNHNVDAMNNKLEKYSLSWFGDNGLATLHKDWQKLRQKSTVIKTTMLYSNKIQQELSNNNTLEINSVLTLPYKINKTIPKSGSIEIRLMPL